MYLDLIVVLVIAVIGLIKYRQTSSYIYLFCITDMVFRVLSFLNRNIKVNDINKIISKYVPESIEGIIYKYTGGIVETVLIWVYVVIFIMFIYYTLKTLSKKR